MLIPHGPWALVGNPNQPDGLRLVHLDDLTVERRRPTRTTAAPTDGSMTRGRASGVLGVGAGAAADALVEDDLAQADVVRRHLDALVVGDELERLLERHRPRRHQPHRVVGARRRACW